MSSSEKRAADPATAVGGMNEEQEHLAVRRMNGRIADNAVGFLDRDQQHIRLLMVGDELLPVLWRE